MRTFPRSLAAFRQIVNERGERLRQLSLEELKALSTKPTEHLTVESRWATISIIVQPQSDGSLRVVVQGFMEARFLGFLGGKNVALDGFYKLPGGTVIPMTGTELYEFD